MRKAEVWKRAVLCALPFGLLAVFLCLRPVLLRLAQLVPACPFYTYLHWNCPACGNTRALFALFRGQLVYSMQCNLTPLVLLILGILWYLQTLVRLWGKRLRLLPSSRVFWFTLVGVMLAYYFLRGFVPWLCPPG